MKDVLQTLIRSLTVILVVIMAVGALFGFFDSWRVFRLIPGGFPLSPSTSSPQSAPADPETTLQGAALGDQLYRGACQGCHGDGGQGGIGPALAGNARLQDSSYVVRAIMEGPGIMPSFNQLSDPNLAALATHIRTHWGNDFGPVTPEEVRRLR